LSRIATLATAHQCSLFASIAHISAEKLLTFHVIYYADMTHFAEAVGLDRQKFTRDMMQQRHLPLIEEDMEGGERSGVQGTPTFFINGVLYRGSWQQEALHTALEAASRGS
jgi:predicted DsbA family dithiol-disulfide isomerase